MNDLQKLLLETSEAYTTMKKKLEYEERIYNGIYAGVYLQERITGMKTEEMRKNEMIRIMESEHKEMLDRLMNLKGDTRALYYRREALAIILGGKVGYHE